LRDLDDPGLYIGAPIKARATGNWTVYVARRINGPDGIFLGVVTCALEGSYLEDFYRSVMRYDRGSVPVFRRDGTVLARYPHTEDVMGTKMPA